MMLQPLVLNAEFVNSCLQQNDCNSLVDYLSATFKLQRNADGMPLQFEYSQEALVILNSILDKINRKEFTENSRKLSIELFRSLRNYATNPQAQDYIVCNGDILNNTVTFLQRRTLHESHDNSLKIVLQLLTNVVISNKNAADKIFRRFSSIIFRLLSEKRYLYEVTALLYNIILHTSVDVLHFDIFVTILNLYQSHSETEYLYFLLEQFIQSEKFWQDYHLLEIEHRIITLEIIRDKQIGGNLHNLSNTAVKIITNQFITSNKTIFQTVISNNANLEVHEVSLLLEILASLCSDEDYLQLLQNDKDLLINTGVILINIHRLGKESENYFTAIQRLADVRDPNETIKQHPAFGFKVGLIRIIGNLCWKNRSMQDLVREAELIPVLLDCCNMDARNPFIMQWVILAIRNLSENNRENQSVIAGMHQEGTVSSSTLEEMGLTLHSDGNDSIKIVPLDSLRRQR